MKLGLKTRTARNDGAELLAWDSEWWSTKIARGYNADLTRWALDNMVGCMFLLFGSDEQEAMQRAEGNGARFMDIRVELARDTKLWKTNDWCVRPFIPRDIDRLAAISRTAFRGLTRFYADPQLPDDRCDDLYENWVRTSPGWAAEILVIKDGMIPAGFVTIHVDDNEASIGLIAVDDRVRGRGFGVRLTEAAVEWAYQQNIPEIKVVTQGCNIPAQRAFQHAGFVTTKTECWFHQWL